jgi:hypothetical protein
LDRRALRDLLTDEEQRLHCRLPRAAAAGARAVRAHGHAQGRAVPRQQAELRRDRLPGRRGAALLPTGWIERDPVLSLDELFELLPSRRSPPCSFGPHAPKRCTQGRAARSLARRGLRRPARRFPAGMPRLHRRRPLRILIKPLCDRLRLIFFGNLRQDWTEFVLSDLGVYRFEQVEFSPPRAVSAPPRRRPLPATARLQGTLRRGRADRGRDAALPVQRFDNDWLDSRREKLLFQVGQHFEKQQDWERAIEVYTRCRYPRFARPAPSACWKRRNGPRGLARCCAGRGAPESDAERQHLLRMKPRLARKLGHPKARDRQTRCQPRAPRPLPADAGRCDWWVEGVVRDHLGSEDAPVFYVENMLANALFGLLCWRAIFCRHSGRLLPPLPPRPADLHSARLPPAPRRRIRDCLAQLRRRPLPRHHPAHFEEKAGITVALRVWESLDRDAAGNGARLHPGRAPEKMVRAHPGRREGNRTGFPDLIQFWPASGATT